MKNTLLFSAFVMLLLLVSCVEGPIGPIGPQGPQGVQGLQGESGFLMEWQEIDFTNSNDYRVTLPYADFNFEGLDTDVSLAFLLWDTFTNNNNEVVEVWRPLPQQVYLNDGSLSYNYDFSRYDVQLFLDATFPLSTLSADDTDAWVVRVIVVPANAVSAARVDVSDYHSVVKLAGLSN